MTRLAPVRGREDIQYFPEVDALWMGLGPPAPSPPHDALSDEAARAAEYAAEKMFASRRGVIEVREQGLVVFYDNSPFPDRTLRARWLRRLLVAASGRMDLVGHGAYPTTGEDAGYTVALVFAGGTSADLLELGHAALREVLLG